jgi:hypothetical protein
MGKTNKETNWSNVDPDLIAERKAEIQSEINTNKRSIDRTVFIKSKDDKLNLKRAKLDHRDLIMQPDKYTKSKGEFVQSIVSNERRCRFGSINLIVS